MQPTLSIIMAAYNGKKTIAETVKSILLQTFTDFELIIINDGSSDDTEKIILSFQDSRIRYAALHENKGTSAARNLGLKMAKGRYIGIFDADDLALPEKFKKQIDYLEANPECGIIGCSARIINEEGKIKGSYALQASDKKIRAEMIFHNYFIQSALVFRHSLLSDGLVYNENFQLVEDYQFILELLQLAPAYSSKDYLLHYRDHPSNSMAKFRNRRQEFDGQILDFLFPQLGVQANEREMSLHLSLKNKKPIESHQDLKELKEWLKKLGTYAVKSAYTTPQAMRSTLVARWLKVCFKTRFQILLWPEALFSLFFFYFIFKFDNT